MRVLITGGAGFIGSHLVDRLLKEKAEICVVDNFLTGRRGNLPVNDALSVVEGTITDAAMIENLFSRFKPDYVIHAAASYKDPEDWMRDAVTNIAGTINVVKAAKKVSVKRLIYFQTALCYGVQPIERPITIKHPLFSGGSSYAISKTAGEQYIEIAGLNFISFRLANIIGPRNLSGPIAAFYHRIVNQKPCFISDTRRDFVFVSDLVEVVLKAIKGMGKSGHYHVASGRDYAIEEVFNATIAALNIKLSEKPAIIPPGKDDAPSIFMDPSATERDFAWRTTTPLEDAVRKAVDWYKNNSIEQTYTHLKINK